MDPCAGHGSASNASFVVTRGAALAMTPCHLALTILLANLSLFPLCTIKKHGSLSPYAAF